MIFIRILSLTHHITSQVIFKITCIVILSVASLTSFSQESITTAFKNEVKKANAFYNDHYYQEAVKNYLNAHKLDPRDDIKVKIADCYVKLNEPESACQWFKILIDNNFPLSTKDMLNYVLALTGNADYKEAQIWYEKYLEATNDTVNNNLAATKKDLALFYRDSTQYDIREAEINTLQSEFSPVFYDKGIAYISSRKSQLFIQNNLPQSSNGYLNIFYAPFDKIKREVVPVPMIGPPKIIQGEFPTNVHKGPFTIVDKNMYITLNDFSNNAEEQDVKKLSIYELRKKGKKWITPVSLPFNNNDYSCGHPTLSTDGKTMYFISDMPGGYGGTDIYKVELNKGKWSTPVNMGPKINTLGNEMFPFLHNDTTLYFASNGHLGIGGLDIFKFSLSKDGSKSINVGYPINTQSDDFGLTLNENGSIGFFSSNRKNKGIDDDIYKVIINVGKPGPLYSKNVSGSITMYESQYQLENPVKVDSADVIVIDFDSLDPVVEGKTDAEGNFKVDIPYAGKFFLMCNKKGAGSYQTVFSIPEKSTFKEDFYIVFFSEDLFETE